MQPKLSLALCFFLAMFTACKKQNTLSKRQIKVPVKITWVSNDPSFNYTKTFIYGYEGRIVGVAKGGIGFSYLYNGDDLVSIYESYGGQLQYSDEITYVNGLPSKVTQWIKSTFSLQTHTYRLVDNKIDQRDSYKFIYSGNNLAKSIEPNGLATSFKFSNLKSAFYNTRLKYVLKAVGSEYVDDDYFSENAVSNFDSEINSIAHMEYHYTADADGFPSSAVVYAKYSYTDKIITANVTYEYKNIEVTER